MVSMIHIPVIKGALQRKPAFGFIRSAEWFFMNTAPESFTVNITILKRKGYLM